jgi:hypothetical protein
MSFGTWRHTKRTHFGLNRPEGIWKLLWLSTRIIRLAHEESDAYKVVFTRQHRTPNRFRNSVTVYTEKWLYNGPEKKANFCCTGHLGPHNKPLGPACLHCLDLRVVIQDKFRTQRWTDVRTATVLLTAVCDRQACCVNTFTAKVDLSRLIIHA